MSGKISVESTQFVPFYNLFLPEEEAKQKLLNRIQIYCRTQFFITLIQWQQIRTYKLHYFDETYKTDKKN